MNNELRIPLDRISDEGFDVNIELKPEILIMEDNELDEFPPSSSNNRPSRRPPVDTRTAD